MNKKKIISVLTIIIIGAIITVWFYPKKLDYIEVELHYMAYACGDCSLQYEFVEILSSNSELEHIKGELVDVKFTKSMKEEIKNKAEHCMICFNHIVSGEIYKTYSDVYRLSVDKLTLKEREGCCSGS